MGGIRMRFKRFAYLLIAFLILGCTATGTQTTSVSQNTTEAPYTPLPEIVITFVDDDMNLASAIPLPQTPEPTAEPTVIPTPEPTSTPEPTPTPLPYEPADGVYTIAWISDPQHYSAKFPELYESMTSFLRDNRERLHLAYIMHTGDLVNKTSDEAQWEVAKRAQSYIDDIPNGVLAGNHDCQKPDLFKPYSRYFGESHYKDKPWYGESYKDNRGHYDLLTIGHTDYLFVYMSFGPDNGCIKWLNSVFAKYPERIGILLLHDYFTNDFERSEDGEKLFQKVVKPNSNVYMVLCGHRYGAYRQIDLLDDDKDGTADRTVYQMMFNYQAAGKVGGDGYLRLLQVDEDSGTMHMLTYSPSLDDFNRFDEPENREKHYEIDETSEDFILPLPWISENPAA